jgi:HK97 family phage major capsid protein
MRDIEERRNAWKERESRAEAALAEMTDETPETERAAFDAECAEIQTEDENITADEDANNTRQGEIAARLAEIENELKDLEERAKKKPAAGTATTINNKNEREGNTTMNIRERIHASMESETVRTFMQGVKGIMQGRGVSNANYLIPTEFLPILRENISRYSALMKHVNVQRINGEGRQTILGAVPEAVWTEMTGKINELAITAAQISVAGNKVAGYIPVPNAYLEDSDENLAATVLDYLGQSIGFAVDKAILYGTGKNMPVGIMTRLSATAKPDWWQEGGPEFKALNTTHIGKASAAAVNGTALYQEMAKVLGNAKAKYGVGGGKFWAMSGATWTRLQIELMSINAAGSVVTGAQMVMPVIGGAIEILDNIVEDNVIIGGYGSMYLLVERAGTSMAQSEHVRFTDDETVFKATARYDGAPVFGEAFVAIGLGAAPTMTATFEPDLANGAA